MRILVFRCPECTRIHEHPEQLCPAPCARVSPIASEHGTHAYIDDGPREPIPMRLMCPECEEIHIDVGEFATKPHHTHACQKCGNVWRPAVVATVGVRFLPGFKNEP